MSLEGSLLGGDNEAWHHLLFILQERILLLPERQIRFVKQGEDILLGRPVFTNMDDFQRNSERGGGMVGQRPF